MNIKEISELAGVSVATISRVLNHPEQVQPETREHVLAVMKENNYTPNWFARGLNFGRTNTIALFIPDIGTGLYQKMISGIETIARNKKTVVLFCNTHSNPELELEYLDMVEKRRVDGVILINSKLDSKSIGGFAESKIPRVHVGKNRDICFDTLCYIDFEEGAYRMMRHMIGLGYSQIGLMLGGAQPNEVTQIEAGCQHAARETTRRVTFVSIPSQGGVQGGYNAAQGWLRKEQLPRAIVTFSDEQAFGVMKAAEDIGMQIPEQLALACMMDSPMCSIVSPALTSIEQPVARLGMTAARMLFDNIENGEFELEGPQEMVLPPKLKIRRSCGNTKYIFELFD